MHLTAQCLKPQTLQIRPPPRACADQKAPRRVLLEVVFAATRMGQPPSPPRAKEPTHSKLPATATTPCPSSGWAFVLVGRVLGERIKVLATRSKVIYSGEVYHGTRLQVPVLVNMAHLLIFKSWGNMESIGLRGKDAIGD